MNLFELRDSIFIMKSKLKVSIHLLNQEAGIEDHV